MLLCKLTRSLQNLRQLSSDVHQCLRRRLLMCSHVWLASQFFPLQQPPAATYQRQKLMWEGQSPSKMIRAAFPSWLGVGLIFGAGPLWFC